MTDKLAYNVDEVARLLGLSTQSVRRAIKNGEIPAIRVSRRILIPRAALTAMLEEKEGQEREP